MGIFMSALPIYEHAAVKRKDPTSLPVFVASNCEEFEKKTCKTFLGKCYTKVVL